MGNGEDLTDHDGEVQVGLPGHGRDGARARQDQADGFGLNSGEKLRRRAMCVFLPE